MYKLSMMLTIFPLQSVFYPQSPTPFKVSMIFITVASVSGSFSIIYNVQTHKGGKHIHKSNIH